MKCVLSMEKIPAVYQFHCTHVGILFPSLIWKKYSIVYAGDLPVGLAGRAVDWLQELVNIELFTLTLVLIGAKWHYHMTSLSVLGTVPCSKLSLITSMYNALCNTPFENGMLSATSIYTYCPPPPPI